MGFGGGKSGIWGQIMAFGVRFGVWEFRNGILGPNVGILGPNGDILGSDLGLGAKWWHFGVRFGAFDGC